MRIRFSILATLLILAQVVFAQTTLFSLSTDASGLRSFKKGQRYWAIGQTVKAEFHFTPKGTFYAWLTYYSPGRFRNDLTAVAKSSSTNPQVINYINNASLRFKHISLGLKRYLAGIRNSEKGWSLYGYGGFGLMIGSVVNEHSVPVNAANYLIPVVSGKGHFKRLTLDLGLGTEKPLGGDVYLYGEAKALIPTTDYPSEYLFVNEKAPFTGAINLGIRILFGN